MTLRSTKKTKDDASMKTYHPHSQMAGLNTPVVAKLEELEFVIEEEAELDDEE